MNSKLLLCLSLVSSGLFGCSIANKHPAATSNIATVGTYISEIHMIDDRNGWAWSRGIECSNLLQDTLLLHTSDGGQTWQNRSPHAFSYRTEGCCFLDSQTAWVSTSDRKTYAGGLLHTADGGKSWSVLIKQGTAPYGGLTEDSDCRFFNANVGVANVADGSAGMTWRRFYMSHNGGKNWDPVIIVPPSGHAANDQLGMIGLSDIAPESMGYCPPANVIISHGDLDDEQPKDAVRLSITTNLGTTWHDVKLPLPSEMYRDGLVECDTPIFLNGKNGWMPVRIVKWNAGHVLAWNVLAFYTTDDGGETWTPRPGIIEGGTNFVGSYRQLDLVSGRDIFVCNGANLCVTHDGAESWRTIKPDIDLDRASSHGGVLQIDFVDAMHGWAVVYDTFKDFPHEKYYVYKTSDGGATWMELPLRVAP